jgi:hypothetical protein
VQNSTFFSTGGALRLDYPYYILRQADYAANRALYQGKLIYTIAPRQMGKTSLLKRLLGHLEAQGWCCCFIDLATMRNLDQARWFRNLGTAIAWVCDIPRVRSSLNDQQEFRAFLLDEIGLRSSFPPLKLALFFDEVEGITGLDFSDDFLMTMRDLYQQRDLYVGELLVAFAGVADPATLVKDPTISPFNIAEEIALHDFSPAESLELTSKLELKGVPIDPEVHDRIYAWVAGQPYLTQRLCELLERRIEAGQTEAVTPKMVDQCVQNVLLNPRTPDKNIKHVLQDITNPSISPPKIWQRLLAGEPIKSTEPGFYRLYLSGIAAEAPDGQVQIRNNVYRAALGLPTPLSPLVTARRVDEEEAGVLNPGKAWAVLVGINAYDDPYIADLKVCVSDVAAIQTALAPSYQTAQLLTDATPDSSPSRANILGALAAMTQAAGENDLLVFYFSGHGTAEDGESYLLPRDARLAALKHTALAMSDVRQLLDQSQARAKVIILDACHSGVAMGKATPLMSAEFIQRVFAEAEGLAIFASCKQGQRSWEWPEQQQSVFTYYLLEALQGKGDFSRKGFVTVSDASAYVTDRVKIWSAEHHIPQTPTLQYAVSGDIVLCHYAGPDINRKP